MFCVTIPRYGFFIVLGYDNVLSYGNVFFLLKCHVFGCCNMLCVTIIGFGLQYLFWVTLRILGYNNVFWVTVPCFRLVYGNTFCVMLTRFGLQYMSWDTLHILEVG